MNPIEQDKMVGRIGIMPAVMEPVVVLDDSSIFKKENLLQNFDKIIEVDNKPIKSVQALDDALENLWPSSVIKIEREGADGKKQELVIQAPNQGLKQILEADVIIKNTAVADADTPKLHTKIEATESLLVKDRKKTFAHWGVALAMGSIKELKENSPAASLGLKKGDRIVSVNGERLLSQFHLQQSLLQNMKKIQVLGVVTPAHDMFVYAFKLPDSIEENFKLDAGLPDIFGISLPNVFHQGETIGRNVGPIEAFNRSIKQTYSIISMTTKSIWMLIKGDAPASSIGGPIQLFDVAQQAAHKGLSYYLYVMCLLSVNLGLLNLLPIPALDGGHLLLFAIEAIQRKPLTIRTRAIAMQIGFAILLSIMVLAVFNDISRLFR